MRPDLVLLRDIERAADAVHGFITGLSHDAFIDDDLRRSAVMYKLIVIGEAANRVTPRLRAAHDEIDWPGIVAFRNRATHGYFAVDWSIAFEIASADLPGLRAVIEPIIAEAGI